MIQISVSTNIAALTGWWPVILLFIPHYQRELLFISDFFPADFADEHGVCPIPVSPAQEGYSLYTSPVIIVARPLGWTTFDIFKRLFANELKFHSQVRFLAAVMNDSQAAIREETPHWRYQ